MLKSVVGDGLADNAKSEYVSLSGKTGTAQIGGKQIDNALFVCAAPYNDPDIVISVVIDKGAGGSYSSLSAARVLEAYYGE